MIAAFIEKSIIKNLADRALPIYLTHYDRQGFNEADVLGISGAGLMYEYEIKVSRADFLADFKNKQYKHLILSRGEGVETYDKWVKGKHTDDTYELITLPNKFYFACPVGLIKLEDIPTYAGLVYIDDQGEYIEIKPAPFIHRAKANEIIYKSIAATLSERLVWGRAYRSHKLLQQKAKFEELTITE